MSILILGLLFITSCMPAQNGALLAAETIPFLSSDSSEQFPELKDLPANDSGLSSMEYEGESDSYYEGLGKLKIELALDGFKVWPDWVQINASFSVVYQFDLGKDSHPTNILLLTGERHIDTKAAEACLAKWTFSGLLPKKKYVLVLNWEHIKGYTSMTILGDQMSLSVRLQKDQPTT